MKAVVAAFNQEKALVVAFSVITNLRMQLFGALVSRDIAVGEILIVSEPAATLLAPEKLDKLQNHCTHCHLFSKAPIPCEVEKY